MADEQDFTTKTEVKEVISILRTVRATGDLLCAANDSVSQGRSELYEDTLPAIGNYLEELATKGLVLLKYE